MPYTNTPVTTSVSGSWNGTSFDYSSIALIDGIPHDAQLEIERVFTTTRDSLPITDFLNNPLFTAKDKREVFVIPNSRITFNETTKTITAIDLPNTGNVYNYDPVDAEVSDVQVPEIAVSQSLKVRRKSVSNSPLVTWTAGNKLTSNQLNLETKQLLYLTQELIDKVTTETTVSNVAIGDIPDGAVTPTKLSGGHPSWTSGGNFSVDTNVLFVDASNNRVGVNTSSPAFPYVLDIAGSVNISGGLVVSGGHIRFPVTQSISSDPNTLDDYEEGTWTPALNFNGNSVGITYSEQDGIYTKIGRLVYITGRFYLSDKGSSTGVARVSGLPFPCVGGNLEGVFVSYAINMAGLTSTPTGLISSEITFFQAGPTGSTTLLDTNFTNTSTMRFSGVYIAT